MIRSIPLNKLVQSSRNVRRHGDPAADAELKASIAAHGLLQNLIVRPAAKGRFEVEAGERRRTAMLALVEDKVLPKTHEVTCLVLDEDAGAVETSLAENFHRLAMNPADEARAFSELVSAGAQIGDVARRFGLTARFVEGRLRLADLAPVVLDALASGEITLDMAKAYGATSDQEIQTRVFEQVASAYYRMTPDSVRRMVLNGTVCGTDPRARFVGRDAYVEAGGRIDRELFDSDETEAWVDVVLLEQLATAKMAAAAERLAAEQGVAWVKPTLDAFVSHHVLDGLVRLPTEPAPLTEAELERLDKLDASYDQHAAIIEDEGSADEAIKAAEATLEAIERECQDIRSRPPVIAPELKAEAGMILTLGRDGTPQLEPLFFTLRDNQPEPDTEGVVVTDGTVPGTRAVLSKRLVDELAMQRRDILSLHLASDPALALDVFVFTLADVETRDWSASSATTLRGGAPAGPIIGFEPADAHATVALAELRTGLDESWRSGADMCQRFDLYRALSDEARAAWLGFVVGRSLEASLNMSGVRRIAFHDHLGQLMGIETAQWWRPTAANYFDRVSKQLILEAMSDVGGPELSARFASVKKADLAASAERIFAGTYTDAEVRERALAWIPHVMRFAAPVEYDAGETSDIEADPEPDAALAEGFTPHELAA
jgi:ParB family chromosome partitioning protein